MINLDVSSFVATLDAMDQKLKDFPNQMGEELTEWQTEDMHRKYPNTQVAETYVQTSIWPTSRARLTGTTKPIRRVRRVTQRPILRPQLYDMLVARMNKLLDDELNWKE